MQMNETEWEKLTITSDFIFGKVMQDPQICRELLQRIFPEFEIKELTILETQKEFRERPGKKYICLDVYTEDGIRKFDVEMQMNNAKNLTKRTRYYHSLIDTSNLLTGQSYRQLSDTYVIFFCPFDPFQKKRSIYTFRNLCIEEKDIELKDGNTTIFINSKGNRENVSVGLLNFLDFMEGNFTEEDWFIQKINEAVIVAKGRDDWRCEYNMYLDIEEEAFDLGKKEGQVYASYNFYRKGLISEEEAAENCNISVEEFREIIVKFQ